MLVKDSEDEIPHRNTVIQASIFRVLDRICKIEETKDKIKHALPQ
jgi:hypothetical protein